MLSIQHTTSMHLVSLTRFRCLFHVAFKDMQEAG